jgi:hypothetical protein
LPARLTPAVPGYWAQRITAGCGVAVLSIQVTARLLTSAAERGVEPWPSTVTRHRRSRQTGE